LLQGMQVHDVCSRQMVNQYKMGTVYYWAANLLQY